MNTFFFVFILGIPSVLDISFLDNLDAIARTLLIAGGFLVTFLMGWVLPRSLDIELKNSCSSLYTRFYIKFMLRYVTPILVAAGFFVSLYSLINKLIS